MKKRKLNYAHLVITIIAFLGIIAVVFFSLKFIFGSKDTIEKQFTFEFGNTFMMEDIVKDSNRYEGMEMDAHLSASFDKKTTDQLAVGDYIMTFEDEEAMYIYTVSVVDTIDPIFSTYTKTIYLPVGSDAIDSKAYYQGQDRSKVTIAIDDTKVDYQSAGTYVLTITIKDAAGNQWSDQANVVIGQNNQNEVLHNYAKPYYVDGILVVNKLHPIPKDFALQENEVAGQQIRDMQAQGYNIASHYSGYRNHDYQTYLYNNYVAINGKSEAGRFSARPGYSEHETGLTFDLIDLQGQLVESEKEATWIAEHAHEYGFIVRYPKGKEEVTGYIPEAWHLRYIGDKAKDIYESKLTLEEYLNVPGGMNYNE